MHFFLGALRVSNICGQIIHLKDLPLFSRKIKKLPQNLLSVVWIGSLMVDILGLCDCPAFYEWSIVTSCLLLVLQDAALYIEEHTRVNISCEVY